MHMPADKGGVKACDQELSFDKLMAGSLIDDVAARLLKSKRPLEATDISTIAKVVVGWQMSGEITEAEASSLGAHVYGDNAKLCDVISAVTDIVGHGEGTYQIIRHIDEASGRESVISGRLNFVRWHLARALALNAVVSNGGAA